MFAIILFSHGSLLCGAGETLAATARRMRERGDAEIVEVGYLNYSEPLFPEAFERCVAAGATRITVVPYFLAAGYFAGVALPREVAKLESRFPHIDVRIASAMQFHLLLADALLACAQRTAPPEQWPEILNSAPQFCRNNSQCPLFGTPQCPAPSLEQGITS